MTISKKILPIFLILLVALAACDALPATGQENSGLKASGVVEAVEVVVAPEMGGRVAEVFVEQGDQVSAGDALFRIEDDLLAAQRAQVEAAKDSALANLATAQANLEAAESALNASQIAVQAADLQHDLALNAARFQDQPSRQAAWSQDPPDEFDLPVWYFDKSEEISSAQAEVDAASAALETEQQNFQDAVENASNNDIFAAESRLGDAQAAFLVAQELLDREIAQNGREEISSYIQDIYDTAKAELEAAQLDYNQMLSDQAFADVLEARARLAVAKERYELALDQLNALFTGDEALTVEAAVVAQHQAEAGVMQAEANVSLAKAAVGQAEAALAEAQAALDVMDVQIAKLTVKAAVSGVVMVRNIEPGETLSPGLAAITLGRLDHLTITVYIPESQYGQINLDDHASVTADSFPGIEFDAVVSRIANQAEYTPRNVQTQEERSTTVFAIELSVDDLSGRLKPGMPADVNFTSP